MLGQRASATNRAPGSARPPDAAAMEEGNLRMTVEGGKLTLTEVKVSGKVAPKAAVPLYRHA
jgi:hypothetical protein